jgi:PIN domain nuclease of toxin-antitoxin system
VKLLLDTHTFIWWDKAPDRLSGRALRAITRSSSEVFLSVVSLWEMAVKSAAGKLELHGTVRERIEVQLEQNALRLLSIEPAHVWALNGRRASAAIRSTGCSPHRRHTKEWCW